MFSLTSFLDTLTSVNPENVPKYVFIVVAVLLGASLPAMPFLLL